MQKEKDFNVGIYFFFFFFKKKSEYNLSAGLVMQSFQKTMICWQII